MWNRIRSAEYRRRTKPRAATIVQKVTFASFVLISAIACGGTNTPPTDEQEGLGGKSGTSDIDHESPAFRTARGQAPPRLSREGASAVTQLAAGSDIVEAVSRASTRTGSRQFAAMTDELIGRRLELMRALNVLSGYVAVANAGRATSEYEMFRRQTEPLEGQALELALLAALAAVYERDLANLEVLGSSGTPAAQRFAEHWTPHMRADLMRVQQSSSGPAPEPPTIR
jgi:hypothetical protein